MKDKNIIRIINIQSEGLDFDLSSSRLQNKPISDLNFVSTFKKEAKVSQTLNFLVGKKNLKRFLCDHLLEKPYFHKTKIAEKPNDHILDIDELLTGIQSGRFSSSRVHFYSKNADPMPMTDYQLRRFNSKLHLEDGGSISVRELQWAIPAIRQMASDLQYSFGANINVNAYLTPPGTQTFSLHWDDHDTLALQLFGTKVWSAYEPVEILPTQSGVYERSTPEKDFKKINDFKLTNGCFLYLPRGHIHKAVAQDDFSLHITFGIHSIIPSHFIKTLWPSILEKIQKTSSFGNDISLYSTLNNEEISNLIKTNIKIIIDEIDIEQCLRKFTGEYWENLQKKATEPFSNHTFSYSGVPFEWIDHPDFSGLKTKQHAIIVKKNHHQFLVDLVKKLSENNLQYDKRLSPTVKEIFNALNEVGLVRKMDKQ